MSGGRNAPPSVLAEWAQIANPSNPSETRGWDLVVLSAVLLALTLFAVLLRLWARFVVRKTAGIDDLFICLAMIPTSGLAVATSIASRNGFDRHAWDLTPGLAIKSRKLTMIMEATYIASTGLTKISILLFYRRMSDGSINKTYRWIVCGAIASVAAYIVAFLLALFFVCRPFEVFWLVGDPRWRTTHQNGVDYHCVDEAAILLASCAISIVHDFMACGLPLVLFWDLQIPQRQKVALAGIFGVGFFLCVTGCLRIYYIHKVFYMSYDTTWVAWDAWIWTVVEAHIGIICASAPALKVFVKRYLDFSSVSNSLSRTYRPSGYSRSGNRSSKYAGGPFGTTSIIGTNTMNGPIKLEGINVTKDVAVASHLKPQGRFEAKAYSTRSSSDEEILALTPEQNPKFSWLNIDQTQAGKR